MRIIYFGGMILGNIDDHYAYENALARFIEHRIKMFDKDTFWAKHRRDLVMLERMSKFPESAYYHIPEDPLVAMPFPDFRVMLLKSRYLIRLRQKLLKYMRCKRSVPEIWA